MQICLTFTWLMIVKVFWTIIPGEASTFLDESKELIVIDVDAGSDDAQALLLALFPKFSIKFTILGITCVGGGNTALENVYANVLRVLKIAGAEQIPVYKGSPVAILGNRTAGPGWYFGDDGFGGIGHTITVDTTKCIKKHAVIWLYETVQAYPGRVTLIALGPLTNAAMAQILYPDFSSNLKKIHILGGSIDAEGSVTPEFNMESDPEAAHVIFNKFNCPITVLAKEAFMEHALSWDWYTGSIINGTSSAAKFMKNLDAQGVATFYMTHGFVPADLFAVAIFFKPDLIQKREFYAINIELGRESSRGCMLVDRLNAWNKTNRVEFVTKLDKDGLALLVDDLLSNFTLNYT